MPIGIDLGYKPEYIDKKGNIIIPPIFHRVRPFKDGVTLVEKDYKCGLVKNPLAPQN